MDKLTKQLLQYNVQAQLDGLPVLPARLTGLPGVGKTSSVRALAKQLGIAFSSESLPSLTLSKLGGIPDFHEEPSMSKYYALGDSVTPKSTVWTVPEFILKANKLAEQHGGCIMLLDDFHALTPATSSVMYDLLLERQSSGYSLHPKVAIVCAMNDSKAAGLQQISSAIIDRTSLIHVKFHFDTWFESFGVGLNYLVSSFAKTHPDIVQEPESTGIGSTCTPRSMEYFSTFLNSIDDKQFIANNTYKLAAMFMSSDAAFAFEKHCIEIAKINFESIVKSQQLITISDLSVFDSILYTYMINFIHTPEDAVYMLDMFNHNSDDANFIGWSAGILSNMYRRKLNGETISVGQSITLAKVLNIYKADNFKLTAAQKKALKSANLDDLQGIHSVMSKYL